MWWPLLLLKISSPLLLTLASALLITGIFTDNWVVLITPLGIYRENLWKSCIESTCFSLERGWEYDVFVIGFLGTAAGYSVVIPVIVLLLLYVCKMNKFLAKKFRQTLLMPVLATMIAMSVYTGHYTYDVDYKDRGFSFWLAWSSFPISLVAVFAGLCHTILQEIEEENEIILNVIPGN